MIDYTKQRKILEAIEEDQEQDTLTGIQLIFYLSPLFGKRHRTRACFDLMEFEGEKFFEIREKNPEKKESKMDTQFGICSNCGEFILSAGGCDCWKEEAYTDSEPWEPDEEYYNEDRDESYYDDEEEEY